MPTKTPEYKGPGENLRKAFAEGVRLTAPMEIARHRLAGDQRKQDGADGEIDKSDLDEGFQW